MDVAISHDVSPVANRYKKTFPRMFGMAQIVFAELSLLFAICVAITDTQLDLAFTIREYAIMCAGWPLYTLAGLVGVLVGRKRTTKILYVFYVIISLIAALAGAILMVACIIEAFFNEPHPLLNSDSTYKEMIDPDYLELDLNVKKERKAIPIIFWLAAVLNLSQFAFGLCILSAFCDDHELYQKDKTGDKTTYELNDQRVELQMNFDPEADMKGLQIVNITIYDQVVNQIGRSQHNTLDQMDL